MKSLIYLLLTSLVWIHADGENIEINIKQMVYGCAEPCEPKSVADIKDESETPTEGGQGSIAITEFGENQTDETTHTDDSIPNMESTLTTPDNMTDTTTNMESTLTTKDTTTNMESTLTTKDNMTVSTTQELSTTFNESTSTTPRAMQDCIWGNTTIKHMTWLFLSMCYDGEKIMLPNSNYSGNGISQNTQGIGAGFRTLDASTFVLYNINCRVDVLTLDGRRVVSANILTLPNGKVFIDEMTFEFNPGEPLTCRFYQEEIKLNCSFDLPKENEIIKVSNDVFVSLYENQIIIETLKGISVIYQGISLGVGVENSFTGGVIGGIVGRFNGNKNDDYTTRTGEITNDVNVFLSSWKTFPNDTCTSSSNMK